MEWEKRSVLNYSSLADEVLMKLIPKDPSGILSVLYDRYGRLVFSIALQTLESREAAEEVTQEVFLQLWKNAAAFRPDQGKLVNWLCSIARYRAIDRVRRRNSRPEGRQLSWEMADQAVDVAPHEIESAADLADEKRRVRAAVAQLPEEQQKALALAFFYGYTHREIAEALGIPLGTVKTRIRLGLRKLRQALQPAAEPEG